MKLNISLALILTFFISVATFLFFYSKQSPGAIGGTGPTGGTSTTVVYRSFGPADIYPPSDVPGMTNPNITQATISQTICNPKWSTKSIRPPVSYTDKLKVQDMQTYHLSGVKGDFELDHLISLELGGNPTDPKNLWMEPYTASIPDGGAKVKDSVENYLHKQVCSGAITLAEAQKEITGDWYAVYKSKNAKPTYGAIDTTDQDDQ
jgi:hypothetical protein